MCDIITCARWLALGICLLVFFVTNSYAVNIKIKNSDIVFEELDILYASDINKDIIFENKKQFKDISIRVVSPEKNGIVIVEISKNSLTVLEKEVNILKNVESVFEN